MIFISGEKIAIQPYLIRLHLKRQYGVHFDTGRSKFFNECFQSLGLDVTVSFCVGFHIDLISQRIWLADSGIFKSKTI
jgi:hypothetical protein